jgi:hypothetical protein
VVVWAEIADHGTTWLPDLRCDAAGLYYFNVTDIKRFQCADKCLYW